MHVKIFSVVVSLLLFCEAGFTTPNIQHWQTANGAKVYFVEARELPMVDIQITFDAGSARDPEGLEGLSVLVNSLLSQGADGLDADEISYEFERLGANFGSDAGYDSASVSLRSLSDKKKLKLALSNLRKVMTAPDFPDQALERQRKRFQTALQQKQQSPSAIAKEAFYAAIYGSHPYSKPKSGTPESIVAIRRDQVLDFYAKHYVSANAVIAIVGDLNKKQARKLAKKLSTSLKKGEKPSPLPTVSVLNAAEEIRINHRSTQTHILLGQPGLKRGDEDYYSLYVGNHILGGSGLVSLLFKEIREKRALSYSAYSYFSPMRENGPFLAGLSTRADQAEEALSVLRETIQGFVKDGLDEEALQAAKKNITGGFPLRIASNSDILGYIAVIGFYGLPLDYLDTFNAHIESVSLEDIKQAFSRRVNIETMVAVLVGPGLEGDKEAP